jgi:hypothetical protein
VNRVGLFLALLVAAFSLSVALAQVVVSGNLTESATGTATSTTNYPSYDILFDNSYWNGTAPATGTWSMYQGAGRDFDLLYQSTQAIFLSSGGPTAFGVGALNDCTPGCSPDVAIGINALNATSDTSGQTAVGTNALEVATTATDNDAFGYDSEVAITTGSTNTAFGSHSLFIDTTGNDSDLFGFGACEFCTSGENDAFGESALQGTSSGTPLTGDRDVAFGNYDGTDLTSGSYNLMLGTSAGYGLTTGGKNTLVTNCLNSACYAQVTTGNQNIAIGYEVAVPSATASGQLDIANAIYGSNNTGTDATLSTGCIVFYNTSCPSGVQVAIHGVASFSVSDATLNAGSGAPSGTCAPGSVYTRTDSSASSGAEMYVCRNVSGNGTWKAVSGG